ncbi:putative Ig domain-containing protein [Vibrio alfacsensis]|uniref:putative Ig domain-containing protein n=1 Tax=Vibrio TaxID=662 RepID=UPI0040682670
MNKVSLLAASVAIALTGCGGSDDGSKPVEARGIVITAIDGYLHNAEIWVDKDGNLANGCELNTEIVTNEDGKATISKADFAGMNVCIKAVAGKTIDNDRGLVAKGFDLASPASEGNNIIVNPMTNMVIEQMSANSELTQEQAEEKVVASISTSITGADSAMIFGDYLANSSNEAKALKVIGETLVDNNELDIETQLAISTEVATETSNIIENSPEDLDNYAPVVDVTDGVVTVKPNSRPVASTIAPVEMIFGDAWQTIDVTDKFSDVDGDKLTYSMIELKGNSNGLRIDANTGVISGTPSKAGQFLYQVFAEDEHGSLSYPTNLQVTITTPNSAPTVEQSVESILKDTFAEERFTQGQEIVGAVYDVTGLFKDADGDKLTYGVAGAPAGVNVTLTADELMITGTPSTSGSFTITLSATDGVHEQAAETTITLTVEEAKVPSFGFNEAKRITLESEIKTKLGELTQNQPITPVTLETTLQDIFPAQNINIPVEYFAGMNTSNSDHQTSIDGIRVDVTDEGVLSLSGTPTQASENGVFYIAAGIYVDQADEVVSSMEQVKLPVVKADETQPSNTLTSFLVNGKLPEYVASMNEALFNSDGGVEMFAGDYSYDDKDTKIEDNKIVHPEGYDEFLYIGNNNNLAVAYAATGAQDLIVWSHDNIDHAAPAQAVPDRLKSGEWIYLMDDAGSNNYSPDMLAQTLNIDNKTWNDGSASGDITITYNQGNTITYKFHLTDMTFEETCKVLSSDEKLIAMSCQWMHDGGDGLKTNYRLFTQDQALASELLNP